MSLGAAATPGPPGSLREDARRWHTGCSSPSPNPSPSPTSWPHPVKKPAGTACATTRAQLPQRSGQEGRRRPLLPLERQPARDRRPGRGRRGSPPGPHRLQPRRLPLRPQKQPLRATWVQVTIRADRPFEPPIGLPTLRTIPELASMELLRKGSRLSVQPVSPSEWKAILRFADASSKSKPKKEPR